jgi:hypothetical protein
MRPGTPHWLRVWATRKYSEGLYFPCNIRFFYVDAATLPPLTRDAKVELHHWLAYIKLAPKALAYAAGMLFVRSNEDRASVVVDTFEERGFPMDELMECVGKRPGVIFDWFEEFLFAGTLPRPETMAALWTHDRCLPARYCDEPKLSLMIEDRRFCAHAEMFSYDTWGYSKIDFRTVWQVDNRFPHMRDKIRSTMPPM